MRPATLALATMALLLGTSIAQATLDEIAAKNQEPVPIGQPLVQSEHQILPPVVDNNQVELAYKLEMIDPAVVVGNAQPTGAIPATEIETIGATKPAISDQPSIAAPPTPVIWPRRPNPKVSGVTFAYFLLMTSMVLTACILALSVYYQIYLRREKRAPFLAPQALSFLFPPAINAEDKISELYTRYS